MALINKREVEIKSSLHKLSAHLAVVKNKNEISETKREIEELNEELSVIQKNTVKK